MSRVIFKAEVTGSPRTPRFHSVGDEFTGYLLKLPVKRHKTDFISKLPMFWDEEKQRPRYEFIYDFLAVSETAHPKNCHYCKKAEPRKDADDGSRRLYASEKQHYTVQKAFASVPAPELFGLVMLRYAGDDETKKRAGMEAPKLWTAEYRIPTDAEVELCDKFLGTDEIVQQAELRYEDFIDDDLGV